MESGTGAGQGNGPSRKWWHQTRSPHPNFATQTSLSMAREELMERPPHGGCDTDTADIVNTRQALAAVIRTATMSFSVTRMLMLSALRRRWARSLSSTSRGPCQEGTAALSRGHWAGPRSSTDQKLPEEQRRGRRGPASPRGGRSRRPAGDERHRDGDQSSSQRVVLGHLESRCRPSPQAATRPGAQDRRPKHEPRPPAHGEARQWLPHHHAPELKDVLCEVIEIYDIQSLRKDLFNCNSE